MWVDPLYIMWPAMVIPTAPKIWPVMFIAPLIVPAYRSPTSTQAAQAGPIIRSLQKNDTLNRNPINPTDPIQGITAIDAPANSSPAAALIRRPHLRLPQRRMIQSESTPPNAHDTMARASGAAVIQVTSSLDKWRVFWR